MTSVGFVTESNSTNNSVAERVFIALNLKTYLYIKLKTILGQVQKIQLRHMKRIRYMHVRAELTYNRLETKQFFLSSSVLNNTTYIFFLIWTKF